MGILDTLMSPGFSNQLMMAGEAFRAADQGRPANLAPFMERGEQLQGQDRMNKMRQRLIEGGLLQRMLQQRGVGPEAFGVLSSALEAAPGAVLPHVLGMAFPQAADPNSRYKVVGGRLVDLAAEGGPGVVIDSAPDDEMPAAFRALHERAIAAGLTPGTEGYQNFMATGGSSKYRRVYGPNGEVLFEEGSGSGGKTPLREFEAKALQFYKRMSDALPRVEATEKALVENRGGPSLLDSWAENIGPAGNFLKSEEFQTYQAAAREWIAGLLRLDSGAAVPESEFQRYFQTYFFAPGDNKQTREAKKKARIAAMDALKAIQPPGSDTAPSGGSMKAPSEMTDEEIRKELGLD